MQNHKLTKSAKKEIRDAIAGLPVLYKQGVFLRTTISGTTMIKKYKTDTVNGEPVDPKKRYVMHRRQQINHYERGQEEYRAGGVAALTAYVVNCYKIGRGITDEQPEDGLADS